jgi:uncharacterized protein (TIGR00251 family)
VVVEPAWRISGDGLVVAVRLTPRGGRDALDGTMRLADGRQVVTARVRAAPEGGAANSALVTLMAEVLAVPRRDVALVAGATSRVKTLHVTGDPVALAKTLERATDPA